MTYDEIMEKGDKIMSKRKIDERQARGESVSLDEIFNEADEIGKMLEESMGSERFNTAIKAVKDEGLKQ
jgi:hypothetical protein|uniref:ORF28 n=1 Tax=Nitrosopumilaceae spindle-shaped virus TaxID=3065433 RepID=A0AAT9J786_9VIRU